MKENLANWVICFLVPWFVFNISGMNEVTVYLLGFIIYALLRIGDKMGK